MSLIRLPPIGFWSYARQDDQLSSGKLSVLRALLVHELQQQYGREPIHLFQDMAKIPLGSDWGNEIKKALDRSTFFIPIITPNFIESEWCSREVELFLEREAQLLDSYPDLSEQSRIFPILFIDIEGVDPENPAVLSALKKLQWFDFRRFRHKNYDEAMVREALSDLAGNMRDLLWIKVSSHGKGEEAAKRPNLPKTADRRQSKGGTPASGAVDPGKGKVRDAPRSQRDKETTARTRAVSHMPETLSQGEAAGTVRRIKIGDVLNHIFEVKRFIKAGGMGEVFEGFNVITGERVAIKLLLPERADDPNMIGMFQREATILTKLNHEALVQYRLLAKEPQLGFLYIVTEFIDGMDLGEALDRVDHTSKGLGHLLGRLASGLAAAHKLGAIHRDISPDNIMLPSGDIHKAKLIDFGIVKDLEARGVTFIGGGFAGKLGWVAPEQLGEYGGEIGTWTDVYSLALVILSAAKGANVDMGGSIADAFFKRREGPDLSAAPEDLRPLLADMLRADPAERLRTMEDVIARLAEIAATQPTVPIRRRGLREAEPGPARHEGDHRNEIEREEAAKVDAETAGIEAARAAAEKGDAGAMYGLGGIYAAGQGVAKDSAEALRWYRAAADKADTRAMYCLGVAHERGDGVTKDAVEAARWYRQAADLGDARAMNSLGVMHERGAGVTQDDAEAVRWFREAADNGNAPAMHCLGEMYERGRGVTKDEAQAALWYREAADRGDIWAMYDLGRLYSVGCGVAKNEDEAARWFRMWTLGGGEG